MKANERGGVLWLSLCCLLASSATAQQPEQAPPTTAPIPVETCFPSCRAGYLCHQGQCISACNPLCAAGETCTSEGSCVVAPTPVAPAPVAPAPVTPTPVAVAPVVLVPAQPMAEPWQAPETPPAGPDSARPLSRVWLEVPFFAGSSNFSASSFDEERTHVTAVAPSFRARIAGRYVMVDLDHPLAFAAVSGPAFEASSSVSGVVFASGDGVALRSGNPAISVLARIPLPNDRGWFAVGLGMTVPLATLDDSPSTGEEWDYRLASTFALTMGSRMRGSWDAWKYVPDRFSVLLPMELEVGNDRFRFGGEVAIAQLMWVGDVDLDVEPEMIAQVGVRVQAYFGRVVSIGARMRGVAFLTSNADDRGQVSLEPFIEITPTRRLLLGAGFLVNIDNPDGVASDSMFVWGHRLMVGVQF